MPASVMVAACPSWCVLPAGHGYDTEVDEAGRSMRWHQAERLTELPGKRPGAPQVVDVSADEYLSADGRVVEVGAVYVSLDLDYDALSAVEARAVAAVIAAAAARAEQLAGGAR